MEYTNVDELTGKAQALIVSAKELATKSDATAEDVANATAMLEEAKGLKARGSLLQELDGAVAEGNANVTAASPPATPNDFESLGAWLKSVHCTTFGNFRDPRLKHHVFAGETDTRPKFSGKAMWEGSKDLVENTGASGGFLTPPDFRAMLMSISPFMTHIRERALVLPMTSRQVQFPVLDQTSTTAGQSHFYGGIVPQWTEEAAEKDETEPSFRQAALIAHKLVCYTEASDELLADSAIALERLLASLFGGATNNEKEFTYIQGTGAGQPLGIVNAGATFRQTRALAGAIGIVDIFNMLEHFTGSSPIWLAHQSTMPSILQLNGPAGNPSYVWISNARDAAPTTLMGYPIYFTENSPLLGQEGDIALCDWSKYVIGERQDTTIDASKHYRFQYDITAWRSVSRVDGRPWLSAPITLRDGTTQVSPFVILDDAVTS